MANPFDSLFLPTDPAVSDGVRAAPAVSTQTAMDALRSAVAARNQAEEPLFSTDTFLGSVGNVATAGASGASTAAGNVIAGTVLEDALNLSNEDIAAYNYVKAAQGNRAMMQDPQYRMYQQQLSQPAVASDEMVMSGPATDPNRKPLMLKATIDAMDPRTKAQFISSLPPEAQDQVIKSQMTKREIGDQYVESFAKAATVQEAFDISHLVDRREQEAMMADIARATQEVTPQMQSAEKRMVDAADAFMANPNLGSIGQAIEGAADWAKAYSSPLSETLQAGALPVLAESVGRQVTAAALTGGNVPASAAVAGRSAYVANLTEGLKAYQEDHGGALPSQEELADMQYHSAAAALLDAGTQGVALGALKKALVPTKAAGAATSLPKALAKGATLGTGGVILEGVEEGFTTYHEEAAKGREASREDIITASVLGNVMGGAMGGGLAAVKAGTEVGGKAADKAAAVMKGMREKREVERRGITEDVGSIEEAIAAATAKQSALVKNIADGNTTIDVIEAKLEEFRQDPTTAPERIAQAEQYLAEQTAIRDENNTKLTEVNQRITQLGKDREAARAGMTDETKSLALEAEAKAAELAQVEQAMQSATGDTLVDLQQQQDALAIEVEALNTRLQEKVSTQQQEIFGSHDLGSLTTEELQAMKSWDLTDAQQMAIDFQTQVNTIQDQVDAVSKNIFQGGQSNALKRNVKGLNTHMTDIVKALQNNDMAAAQESLAALEKFSAGHKTRAETFNKAYKQAIDTGRSIPLSMKTSDGRDYVIHKNSGKLVEAANSESRLLSSAANTAAGVLSNLVASQAAPTVTPEVTPTETTAPTTEAINEDLAASTGIPVSVLDRLPQEQRQRLADIFDVTAPEAAPADVAEVTLAEGTAAAPEAVVEAPAAPVVTAEAPTPVATPKPKKKSRLEKRQEAKEKARAKQEAPADTSSLLTPEQKQAIAESEARVDEGKTAADTTAAEKEQKLAEAKAGRKAKQQAVADESLMKESKRKAEEAESKRQLEEEAQAAEAEQAIRDTGVTAEQLPNQVGNNATVHNMQDGKTISGKVRKIVDGVVELATGMFGRGTKKFPVSEFENGNLVLAPEVTDTPVDPANTLTAKLENRTTAEGVNTALDNLSFKTRPTITRETAKERNAEAALEESIRKLAEEVVGPQVAAMGLMRSSQTRQPEMVQNNPLDAFINENGTLDEEVIQALSEAIHHWAAVESTNLDSLEEEQIIKTYGMTDVESGAEAGFTSSKIVNALRYKGALPEYIITALGTHVARALGVKQKRNARNYNGLNDFIGAIGRVGLEAMSKGGIVTGAAWDTAPVQALLNDAGLTSDVLSAKGITTYMTAPNGTVNPTLEAIRDPAKRSMQTFDRYGTGDLDSDLPLSWASESVPNDVPGTAGAQKASNGVKGQMDKGNRTAWELESGIADFLAMGVFGTDATIIQELFGYVNEERMAELLPTARAAAESRNDTLKRELDNFRVMRESGEPFYYRHNLMRNQRQNMGSYGFSPQASKLVRYLVNLVGTNETIQATDLPTNAYDFEARFAAMTAAGKTTNTDPILKFLGRLGNNMGYEFDNTLPEDVIRKALKTTQSAAFQSGISSINALREMEATGNKDTATVYFHTAKVREAIKSLDKAAPAQALRVLLAWDGYTKAVAGKQPFEYSLWLEIDGKTNGIGFATSQFAADASLAHILGQRVGTLTGSAATLAELKAQDTSFQDGYQSVAKALIHEVNNGVENAETARTNLQSTDPDVIERADKEVQRAKDAQEAWGYLTGITGAMTTVAGDVSGAARKAVKPLLMTIATYGAGAGTAMKVFAGDVIVDGVYGEIQDALDAYRVDGDKRALTDTVRPLLANLNGLLGTPNALTLTGLNGEPAIKRVGTKKLQLLQDFELSAKERKALNTRMARLFATPVNAAINADYGVMRHGKDTLVGGINTAAEVYVAVHDYVIESWYKAAFESAGKPYLDQFEGNEAKALEKFKKVNKLSSQDYKAIRDSLAVLEPRMYTPAADPKDRSTWTLMLGTGKDKGTAAPSVVVNKNRGTKKAPDAGFVSVPTQRSAPVGPGASVAALSIQTLDALIQFITMNKDPKLLNEFDALGYPANTSYTAFTTPNQAFHATMTQYDLPAEMLSVYEAAMNFLVNEEGINGVMAQLGLPALTAEQFHGDMAVALDPQNSKLVEQHTRMEGSFIKLLNTNFHPAGTAPLATVDSSPQVLRDPLANMPALHNMVEQYRKNRELYNRDVRYVSQYNADRQVVTAISESYEPLSLDAEYSNAAQRGKRLAPRGKKMGNSTAAVSQVSYVQALQAAFNNGSNTFSLIHAMSPIAQELPADINQPEKFHSSASQPGQQAVLGQEGLTVTANSLEAIFDKLLSNPAATIRDSDAHTDHLREVLTQYIKLGGNQIAMDLVTAFDATSSGQIKGTDMSITQALHGPSTIPMSSVGELRISAGEAYVHELVHFVSNVAINKDFRLRSQMQAYWAAVKAEAMKPVNAAFYAQNQEMFDRVFHPTTNAQGKVQYLHEFMAYGVTNDAMRQLLSRVQVSREQSAWFAGRTLSEKLVNAYAKMLDIFSRIVKKPRKTMDAEMLNILQHAANIEAHNRSFANHIIGKWMQPLNAKLTAFTPKLQSILNYGVAKVKPGTSRIGIWAKTPINMASLALNWSKAPQTARMISKQITNGVHWMHRSQNSFIKEAAMLMSEMAGVHDKNAAIVDAMRRAKAAIDRNRVDIATTHSNNLRAVFESLTDVESEALTYALGKSDLAALMGSMTTWQELADLVTSAGTRQIAITEADEQLKKLAGKDHSFYSMQAQNLGQYMMTGQSSLSLPRLNAYSISRGPNTNAADPAIEAIVDRLASLYALSHVPAGAMQAATNVINREMARGIADNGFSTAMSLFLKVRADSLKHFENQRDSMMKGYVNEAFDERIDLQVSDIADDTSLKMQGYTLVRKLPVDATIPGQSGKYLYMNPYGGAERMMAGALSLQQAGRKGSNVTVDPAMPAGTALTTGLALKTRADNAIYRKGSLPSPKDSVKAIPVYGLNGQVIDFRYVMDDKTKNSLLKKENKLDKVLPATVANIETVPLIEEQNNKVIDSVYKTFNQFYTGNENEFVEISPYAADDELREHWNMMPAAAKKYAEQVFGTKRMMVRRPELVTVFGRRAYTSRDIWKKQADQRNLLETVYFHTLRQFFGDKATHRIRQASDGTAVFVQYAKDIVVVKSFLMSFWNSASNVAFLQMNGVPLNKYFQNYPTVFRAYQQYMDETQRKHVLEGQLANPRLTANQRRDIEGELAVIEDNFQHSPIRHMVEAGMVQSIEDLGEAQGEKLFEGVPFLEKLNNIDTSGVPGWLKTGAKNIAIMRDSATYRTLRDFAVMGDFVAKYTLIQHRMDAKQQKKKPMALDQAIREAGDLFIDYSLPTGIWTQTMNDLGFAYFTKYAVRLPKHVINTLRHNPMETVLTGVLASAIGVPTVLDSLRIFDPVSLLGTPVDTLSFFDEGATSQALVGLVKTLTN